MPKYQMQWTNEQWNTNPGLVEVEASDTDEAHNKVLEDIKYYAGYLHYDQFDINNTEIAVIKEIL